MSDPLIGATLDGRYRIEAQLEDEVLGRVFAAKDLRGGPVHIKILHDFLAQNREKVSRFERESRAMAAMRHPNLIAMLGEGQVAGRPYLVLERAEGQPLEALLAAGPMPPERAAQIAAQVARALDAAHRAGIVHRNLGPKNIVVAERGASLLVKLRDFGLAAVDEAEGEQGALTNAAARIGNLAYMAPEYLEAGTVDPRGDFYALGAVFFQMITGRPPYEGRYGQVVESHCHAPVPRPTSVRNELPGWTDQIVQGCMAKSPKQRPSSGEEIAQRLELAVGRPLTSALPEVGGTGGGSGMPWGKAGLVGGVVVGLGALAVLLTAVAALAVYLLAG
jgi:serine/threonine protein kinase